MNEINHFRKEIAYFMRRLYKRGLTTTSGGNISVKLPNGMILITASQTDKGRMKAADVGMTDSQRTKPEHKAEVKHGNRHAFGDLQSPP